MKKKISTLLLSFVMALTMVPNLAFADTPAITSAPNTGHTHSYDENGLCTSCGDYNGNHTNWIAWGDDDAEKSTLPKATGNYYLVDKIEIHTADDDKSVNVKINAPIHLDLNGQTIDFNITSYGCWNLYLVSDELYIYDSSTDKTGLITYTGENKGHRALGIIDNGELYMYGGTISNFSGPDHGSAICVDGKNSKFNMYGGTITDCSSTKNGGAVGIGSDTAIFNMYGGTIKNCSSKDGGAVCIKESIDNAAFNMYGGTITKCTSSNNGGGVCINTGNFTMEGGIITDNTAAQKGNGVYNNANSTTIGGTAVIKGNVKEGKVSNMVLASGKVVTLGTSTDGTDGNKVLKPTKDMSVGISTANTPAIGTPVVITNNGTESDLKYFFSDNSDYYMNFVDDSTDYLDLRIPGDGEHIINVSYGDGGIVSADTRVAQKGQTVTLEISVYDGYRIKSIMINDENFPIQEGMEKYTFDMPETNANVVVEFEEDGEDCFSTCVNALCTISIATISIVHSIIMKAKYRNFVRKSMMFTAPIFNITKLLMVFPRFSKKMHSI